MLSRISKWPSRQMCYPRNDNDSHLENNLLTYSAIKIQLERVSNDLPV
jgi:hypothetical protein